MYGDNGIESGWMIESIEIPKIYWTGFMYCGRYKGIDGWSTDPNEGIRLCRKYDGDKIMHYQAMPKTEYQVVDHQWG